MNFPELPPRHRWTEDGSQIRALNTAWRELLKTSSSEETIYYYNNEFVRVWRTKPGHWEDHTKVANKQEAIDVMAALCWLGEADYTLLPEEGEERPTTQE